MDTSKPSRSLNLAQQRELLIAQRRLESGIYDFPAYHMHLSVYVFPV